MIPRPSALRSEAARLRAAPPCAAGAARAAPPPPRHADRHLHRLIAEDLFGAHDPFSIAAQHLECSLPDTVRSLPSVGFRRGAGGRRDAVCG